MKKILCILPAFLFFTLLFVSCKRFNWCDLPSNVNRSSINVTFIDSLSGKYLYDEIRPLYKRDSLKIFDPNGTSLYLLYKGQLIPNTLNYYWIINFGNIYIQQTDANSFDTEICKNYIIQYSFNEFDTVRVCFKSKKAECGGSVFETLKVYRRGQLLTKTIGDTFAEITLTKN